jgi:hypothetical protein
MTKLAEDKISELRKVPFTSGTSSSGVLSKNLKKEMKYIKLSLYAPCERSKNMDKSVCNLCPKENISDTREIT